MSETKKNRKPYGAVLFNCSYKQKILMIFLSEGPMHENSQEIVHIFCHKQYTKSKIKRDIENEIVAKITIHKNLK